jgi:uncharacterized membrane protein YjjB (DUF3815 family)
MSILYDPLFAALAALGFAIIFNVPKKYLLYTALTAIVGFSAKSAFIHAGNGVELSTLAGAVLVGVMGKLFSTYTQGPHQIITIAAVIPMVPGSLAFQTILSLLDFVSAPAPSFELLTQTMFYASKTGFTLAAIAMGVAAPSLLRK